MSADRQVSSAKAGGASHVHHVTTVFVIVADWIVVYQRACVGRMIKVFSSSTLGRI